MSLNIIQCSACVCSLSERQEREQLCAWAVHGLALLSLYLYLWTNGL